MVIVNLTITSFYAAILALIYVVLAILVIRQRFKCRVGLGTGKEPQLLQTVRMHGNFAEYVPLLLILVALLELQQSPVWQLHLVAGLTLAGRVLHAVGLWQSSGTSVPRFVGMLSTFAALIVGAVFLLMK
nr:MAPEG family protein [Rheinheimera soli]